MDLTKILSYAKKWKMLTIVVLSVYALCSTCMVSLYHTEYVAAHAKMNELSTVIKTIDKQSKTVKSELSKNEKRKQDAKHDTQTTKTKISDDHVFSDDDADILREHVNRINSKHNHT